MRNLSGASGAALLVPFKERRAPAPEFFPAAPTVCPWREKLPPEVLEHVRRVGDMDSYDWPGEIERTAELCHMHARCFFMAVELENNQFLREITAGREMKHYPLRWLRDHDQLRDLRARLARDLRKLPCLSGEELATAQRRLARGFEQARLSESYLDGSYLKLAEEDTRI